MLEGTAAADRLWAGEDTVVVIGLFSMQIVTDTQLFLAIGLPVFAILLNIAAGIVQHNSSQGRFTSIENRLTGLESTMNARFTSLEARFETLTGKVIEIDNRLTRLETLLERH